jgi:hypothetical protein
MIMADEAGGEGEDVHLKMANDLIRFANENLEAGIDPLEIASALRNAAANFTAFARARVGADELTMQTLLEEFAQWLAYYDDHHQQRTQRMTLLERLAADVKKE